VEPERLYSNYLRVGCNAFEFILEFCDYREGDIEARVISVVITTPAFAKAFEATLSQSIKNYEERFGMIPEGG
jgi:hypothetical protein